MVSAGIAETKHLSLLAQKVQMGLLMGMHAYCTEVQLTLQANQALLGSDCAVIVL